MNRYHVIGHSTNLDEDTKTFLLEGWSFEFIVLLFGILPNPELETSVLSVCLNTIATLYSIPYGLSGAVSTRDSNDLGAGNPQGARICVFTMMLVTVMEAILVIMSSILDDHIGQLIWVLCCLLFMLKFVILVARLSSKSELPSIKILSNEFLFEVFKRAQGSHTKCVAACVSKRWHMLLSNVRSSEILPEQEPYQSIRLLAELSSNIQK